MYDPFATPPPPGTVSTTAITPQTFPPVPLPNNALAALHHKHLRSLMPGMGNFDPAQFRQALMDWRAQRPDRPMLDGSNPQALNDWRGDVMDWRQQRPRRMTWAPPGAAPVTGV